MGRTRVGTLVNFRIPDEEHELIPSLLADREERSGFLRAATTLEIAIRSLDVYPRLLACLTANETITEFCARAVRVAAERRIVALRKADAGPPRGRVVKVPKRVKPRGTARKRMPRAAARSVRPRKRP